MNDEQAAKIRALLRSGEPIEIGGRSRRAATSTRVSNSNRVSCRHTSTAGLVAAFAAVYLIWGSTYLAIRYAVETIPPLYTAGLRHLLAGSILLVWCLAKGLRPTWAQVRASIVIGLFFFLIGHGTLHWAE